MPETGKEQSGSTWPLIKFSFLVKFGDQEASFQEVTGLNSETQAIEYRAGNSKVFSTVKMPGIKKYGNVTLKKGVFNNGNNFRDLYQKMVMNTFERKTITISLLDEKNGVAMSWTLNNAFPVKITVSDMKSDGNEIAVETIELAHEGLELVK